MQNKDALNFIEDQIQKRISSFDEKRKFNRKKAFQFTLFTALLAAATTFLIALSQTYSSKLISAISLATSSGMTVLTAWDGLYSYKRRWIQNNDTLMKLYELNSDVQYGKALYGDEMRLEAIDEFYKRYQEILRTANENWKEDRMTSKKD